MGEGRGGGAIHLDEHEPRGIVLLPDDIESGDTRFLEAGPRVLEGGLFEGGLLAGDHVDEDIDDVHGTGVSALELSP